MRPTPYSICINWSVMFTGGHPIVTFLWYGYDVWASKYFMCARFQILWLSDQRWFWVVWFIRVVCWSCLNIPLYIVVYAQILEQLLHIMKQKVLWDTGAAHKSCKAWGKEWSEWLTMSDRISVTWIAHQVGLSINTSDMHFRGYRFES